MTNVLITGSRGFIGSTLREALIVDSDVRVLEFCRTDSYQLLHEYIKIADFIYHFAGEVRPSSSDQEFQLSNSELTAKLVSLLCLEKKKTPVLLSSSVHAVEPRNTYGKTKLESERLLEKYSSAQDACVIVCRLPHVFGPGCKINYNSVLTTWLHNSHNDLEINVFSRDVYMRYCYSGDLADYFISFLSEIAIAGCCYVTPPRVFDTTLGAVVDLIESFKVEGDIGCYPKGSFEERLYSTYLSYA